MNISKSLPRFILAAVALISLAELRGQVGNNNPTGPSGAFNGQVTTGGEYDPYTGNLVRRVTDISVAGAVGQYGLSYTRTWTSRSPGWRSGYGWGIDDISTWHQDKDYTIHFPDGRVVTFTEASGYDAPGGVSERLQPWTAINGTTGYCYLLLPDGGKVEFHGTRMLMTDTDHLRCRQPSDQYRQRSDHRRLWL